MPQVWQKAAAKNFLHLRYGLLRKIKPQQLRLKYLPLRQFASQNGRFISCRFILLNFQSKVNGKITTSDVNPSI
jgi:hypothetical protein